MRTLQLEALHCKAATGGEGRQSTDQIVMKRFNSLPRRSSAIMLTEPIRRSPACLEDSIAVDAQGSSRSQPSMSDVARHAGVAIGTVSNTLNNPEKVSEPT